MKNDSLRFYRDRVAAAEANLAAARNDMRKAAQRSGLSTEGLFADSCFVLRATAERWVYRANRDGRSEGRELQFREFISVLPGLINPRSSPFARMACQGRGRERTESVVAEKARSILRIIEGGATQSAPKPTGLAAEIVKAAKKARGEEI